MGALLSPPSNTPQVVAPPPPTTPTDPSIALAGIRQRKRAQSAFGQGFDGTVKSQGTSDGAKTGAAGMTQMATTTQTSLLGG